MKKLSKSVAIAAYKPPKAAVYAAFTVLSSDSVYPNANFPHTKKKSGILGYITSKIAIAFNRVRLDYTCEDWRCITVG
ncbi:hypothetical protein A6770_06265 [Nostoc minutum NIES-26]|uniref:Uncharacterized protein n=1 Tax=Nostoc minutum NIES-26 TaxID=1844469 RepID=A0A367Q215_9NOSO|nr:hypothetical protein A6770_06265 [Nostoc minutum NIES-26]